MAVLDPNAFYILLNPLAPPVYQFTIQAAAYPVAGMTTDFFNRWDGVGSTLLVNDTVVDGGGSAEYMLKTTFEAIDPFPTFFPWLNGFSIFRYSGISGKIISTRQFKLTTQERSQSWYSVTSSLGAKFFYIYVTDCETEEQFMLFIDPIAADGFLATIEPTAL